MNRKTREQNSSAMSDHDLLIRIDERVLKMDRCITNHLRHHWAVTLAAVTATLTALGAAAAVVLNRLSMGS